MGAYWLSPFGESLLLEFGVLSNPLYFYFPLNWQAIWGTLRLKCKISMYFRQMDDCIFGCWSNVWVTITFLFSSFVYGAFAVIGVVILPRCLSYSNFPMSSAYLIKMADLLLWWLYYSYAWIIYIQVLPLNYLEKMYRHLFLFPLTWCSWCYS